MRIKIAHTPDADDAFMFCAMVQGKVSQPGIEPEFIVEDIESLNKRGVSGECDVSAFSFHAYAYLADGYDILNSGASVGDGYGPIVVAKEKMSAADLRKKVIAIPGAMTSANLAARLALGDFRSKAFPFDRIMDVVLAGYVDAGVLIHEGQITHKERGLRSIIDLGKWWKGETGLPIPLGGNMIKRSLPDGVKRKVSMLLRDSIDYAFEHRDEALDHAMGYARGMDRRQCNTFVSMYVNEFTRNLGGLGRKAVSEFLKMGYEKGVIPTLVKPSFI
jgi:1,4-dihydroxy-6-naphthoate synthase